MSGIIAWVILGLIAGALAKLLYPGHQGGGIFSTIGLGIFGSLIGGYLGEVLFKSGAAALASSGIFSFASLFFAVFGAMLLIFIWGLLTRESAK